MRKTAFNVFSLEELTKTNKRDAMCSVRRTAGVPLPSNGRSLESGSEPQTANGSVELICAHQLFIKKNILPFLLFI